MICQDRNMQKTFGCGLTILIVTPEIRSADLQHVLHKQKNGLFYFNKQKIKLEYLQFAVIIITISKLDGL